MTGLIILAVIITYLVYGSRFIVPFAKEHVRACKDRWTSLYDMESEKAELNREAIWVGIGKSLFWPYTLLIRWIIRHLVDNLTAEERKAKELAEARKVIADYETELLRKER